MVVVLLFVVGSLVDLSAQAADVTPEQRKLLDELLAANEEREKLFGNMHAVWTVEEFQADGPKKISSVEFWSREDKYFRYDQTFTDPEYRVTRDILRKEGSVRFESSNPDDVGVINDFGAYEKARPKLRGQLWFCQANKRLGQTFDYLIEDLWLTSEDVTLEVRKDEGGGLVLTARTKGSFVRGEGQGGTVGEKETFENTETFRFSPDYRFLGSKFRVDYSDGEWSEMEDTMTYGDLPSNLPSMSVPISSFHRDWGSDARNRQIQSTLKEIQLDPAPMEVFYPDRSGVPPTESSSSGWRRRLALLSFGLLCLAIYARYR